MSEEETIKRAADMAESAMSAKFGMRVEELKRREILVLESIQLIQAALVDAGHAELAQYLVNRYR